MTEPRTDPTSDTTEPEPNDLGAEASTEEAEGEQRGERVVVASAERMGIHDSKDDPTAAVEEPAKVMRLGMMIKQLLEEVRSAPLDDAARERMAEVHERSLTELESGLSPELVAELHRITLPFVDDGTPPSDAELRIAQAQLVGWLEGLFHGIQTALVAQQMAAQNQLVEMRRALPPGVGLPGQHGPGQPNPQQNQPGTGHYL